MNDIQIISEENASIAQLVEQYSTQFLSLSKASTEHTIAMCELLHQAKITLKLKSKSNLLFQQLCQKIGYAKGTNDPTIKKYLRIGECADQFKPYLDRLPNSWTSLYEITQLDATVFNKAIESGLINTKMLGKEVKSLRMIEQSVFEKTHAAQDTILEQRPHPSIQILLDTDADKVLLDRLLKELEALKIVFKFVLSPNVIAEDILNQPD